MTNTKVKKHIKALKALFPNSWIKTTKEFDGNEGGIWTGFGEDGTIDYWSEFVDEKLTKYLDKNGLFAEPHDPGTYLIWET